jgi:arylsulfatase A-like enzyme
MDIAPTILDLLDIKTQKNFDGISLKKAMFEDLGPIERVRIGINGFGEGYLCSNEKEAITLTNIGKLSKTLTNNYNKTKLAELTHECQKTISQINQRKKPTNTTTTIAISEELKKELKDLGYID